jgi:hypothetical protein
MDLYDTIIPGRTDAAASSPAVGSFPRGVMRVLDELLCRRPEFKPGVAIRLADDQAWIFPAPPSNRDLGTEDEDYRGLLNVLCEAEDLRELRMAELAMAIFLIRQNYRLIAKDLESLLSFPPGSQALANSQSAFHALAQAHLRAQFEAQGSPTSEPSNHEPKPSGVAGFLTWIGVFWPVRRWTTVDSRGGEALP